jgi:hypothetical protein
MESWELNSSVDNEEGELDSMDEDKSSLVKSYMGADTKSSGSTSKISKISKITHLSNIKVDNKYENQQ